MEQIYVKYNPYRLETTLEINGKIVSDENPLLMVIRGKRLQEWVGKFPQMLVDTLNTAELDIRFYGMPLDWDDFEDAFKQAEKNGYVKKLVMHYFEGKTDEDITDKIVQVFTDLLEGPIDDFRDERFRRAFDNINESIFPINVIATMSSGKSTLINALLQKRLMPSRNEACTATIIEITDNDEDKFDAIAYGEDNEELRRISNLTYEALDELNDDVNVHKICARGNIPFLNSKGTSLKLIDTPGANNSQNQDHQNTTYRAINCDSNDLILYVLNGTQLSTNDDATLLEYVAKQIKKGGKQVRDRFLFVINKMDGFNPQEENIEKVITAARRYLASYGIEDPQIFPCSAYTALNMRVYFDGIDIDNLSRSQERELPSAARDTLPMIDKFVEFDSMHLEKYTTLSPTAQRELDYKLNQAVAENNIKEQAMIHCGIYSIEEAIKAYVTKYAKTKKVKDLVESFQEVLESSQVLTRAKTQVASDEEAARACAERAALIKSIIEDGKATEIFKEKIEALNPIETIEKKAETLSSEVIVKAGRIFQGCEEVITNRDEAKRIVKQFSLVSAEAICEMTAELESVINHEIIETGNNILMQYQEKISQIDNESVENQLDFGTVDLIKGTLQSIRENVNVWCSDDFVSDTVGDYGTVSNKDKKDCKKRGKEDALAKTIGDWGNSFMKVMSLIMLLGDMNVRIDKFSMTSSDLQIELVSKLTQTLQEGVKGAVHYAKEEVQSIKRQFYDIFDDLDELIKQKYDELAMCMNDQKTKEEELEKNRNILDWIEACKTEIESMLDI